MISVQLLAPGHKALKICQCMMHYTREDMQGHEERLLQKENDLMLVNCFQC